MIDLIKKFFTPDDSPKIAGGGQGSSHDIRVATCALFLEMARIDESFTPEEMETLIGILKNRYGLTTAHADALIAEADKELEKSVDLWQFAGLINENYSNTEKIEILETLWRIVFVDGKMDKYENYLMHKLQNLLRLSHHQLIETKKKVLHSENPQN